MTDPLIREALQKDRLSRHDELLRRGMEKGLSREDFRGFIEVSDVLGWKMKTQWDEYKSHPERITAYLTRNENKPQNLSEMADAIAAESGFDRNAIYLAGARMVNQNKKLVAASRRSNGNIDTVKLADNS